MFALEGDGGRLCDGISRRVCKEGPVFRGEDVNFDA